VRAGIAVNGYQPVWLTAELRDLPGGLVHERGPVDRNESRRAGLVEAQLGRTVA
jgi:hypothetical protein